MSPVPTSADQGPNLTAFAVGLTALVVLVGTPVTIIVCLFHLGVM